ncbi:TPA: hypothetical protein U2B31_002025 [Streptococcus suis]|nr:hypothetical protein [Streptococcus suis]
MVWKVWESISALSGMLYVMTSIQYALNQYLAQQVREQSFAGYVQQELYSAIPSGIFLVEDIVHRLGVSVRSLQRNLSAENTSFKQELQAVQKDHDLLLPQDEITSRGDFQPDWLQRGQRLQRCRKNRIDVTVTDYKKQQGL